MWLSVVMSATPHSPTPAIPAATVLLLRGGSRDLEVLMVRRDSRLAFAGGHWVFPGGRVDPADEAGDELTTAQRAAAREAHEEAGLVVEPSTLVAWSHWTPPPESPKRFSTWFFAAAAPAGAVIIDDGEIRDHRWTRADAALAAHRAGEAELSPPTFITLHQLLTHTSAEQALRYATSRDPERFATHLGNSAAGPVALYHGDAAYDGADPDAPGPRHRVVMNPGEWTYERGGRDS